LKPQSSRGLEEVEIIVFLKISKKQLAIMFRDTQHGYIILSLPTTADIGVEKDEVRINGEDNTFGEKFEVKGGSWR
jgi:hypothetical protein